MDQATIDNIAHEIAEPQVDGNGTCLNFPHVEDIEEQEFSEYCFLFRPEFEFQAPSKPPSKPPASPIQQNIPLDVSPGSTVEDEGLFRDLLIEYLENKFYNVDWHQMLLDVHAFMSDQVFYLEDFGFDPATAHQRVIDVLDNLVPDVYADLLEVFWPLSIEQKLEMMWRIVDRIPPITTEGQDPIIPYEGSYYNDVDVLTEYASIGAERDNYAWDGKLVTIWRGISTTIQDQFGSQSLDDSPSSGFQTLFARSPLVRFDATLLYRVRSPRQSGWEFSLYRFGSVNVGVRKTFKQEWRLLKYVPGKIEDIFSIGPGDEEEVTIRTLRRVEQERNAEDVSATETTTETTDSIQSSTDVVKEMSRQRQSKLEASGSVSWGFGSASFGAELSRDARRSTTQTRKDISKNTQTAARKISNRSRLEVKSATMDEAEQTRVSRISNRNNEIPLDYYFRSVVGLYETTTDLSEIGDVVSVAEEVPAPEDIDIDWIRRHDWIIARALISESYRETLNELGDRTDLGQPAGLVETMQTAMTDTIDHLGDLANNTSGMSVDQVDFSQQAQRSFLETVNAHQAETRATASVEERRYYLVEHVRKYILHYCQAIWAAEDPIQRVMRYRRSDIRLPSTFEFLPSLDPEDSDGIPVGEFGDGGELQGFFYPRAASADLVADVIEPHGLLGFDANMLIFQRKSPPPGDDSFAPLQVLKSPYWSVPGNDEDDNNVLVDPEWRYLQAKHDPKNVKDTEIANAEDRILMADSVPELRWRRDLAKSKDRATGHNAPGPEIRKFYAADDLFKEFYAEYQMRKKGRAIVRVKTNQTTIGIRAGEGSAFEPYKRGHRYVDFHLAAKTAQGQELQNENQELKNAEQALENNRREALLADDKLGDPDIEKISMIVSTSDLLKGGIIPSAVLSQNVEDSDS